MAVDFVILTNTSGPTWQRSIGAYQLAHHCRSNGLSCQVIDFIDHFTIQELQKLVSAFVDTSTLAVGISTSFFNNPQSKKNYIETNRDFETVISPDIRELLISTKLNFKNLKIFSGGANSYRTINDNLFDAVFHGYSEQSVVEYLKSMQNNQKRLWPKVGNTDIIDGATAHFDISKLNHKWTIQDCVLPGETLPIEISRGCIFKCKFCSYPLNGKKKFDYLRDPLEIGDELVKNYELYNTTNYFFTDDTFNDSTHKLEQLHKVITDLPFRIKFVTYLRLDLIYAHKEQINLLYDMGLGSAHFGIESLHQPSTRSIGKGMNSDTIKEFLVELHDIHWKKEIPITCSFIIGLPHDTTETVVESHKWVQTAPITDMWFPLFINTDSFYKSEFDINFKEYGYRLDDQGNWYNQYLNYKDALNLAEKFNQVGLYSNKQPSTWFLFSLLSCGYTIKDFKNTAIKDLPWFALNKRKLKLIHSYKKKLLNTATFNTNSQLINN